MTRKTTDPRQESLDLQFFPVPEKLSPQQGSADVSTQIRETIGETLATAKTQGFGDRHAVAAEVSRLAGRDCTKNMLDRYSAPSAEDWRFPLEMLPAFVQATGDYTLLDRIAEACGCKVLRSEEAWIAEYAALLAQKSELDQRLSAFKKELPSHVQQQLQERAENEARRRNGGNR